MQTMLQRPRSEDGHSAKCDQKGLEQLKMWMTRRKEQESRVFAVQWKRWRGEGAGIGKVQSYVFHLSIRHLLRLSANPERSLPLIIGDEVLPTSYLLRLSANPE